MKSCTIIADISDMVDMHPPKDLLTGFFQLSVDICHAFGCQGIKVTGKNGNESYGGGNEGHEHTEAKES